MRESGRILIKVLNLSFPISLNFGIIGDLIDFSIFPCKTCIIFDILMIEWPEEEVGFRLKS